MIHFHKWTVWSLPLVNYRGNKQQWRVCTVCHKADFRNLRWDSQTPISEVMSAITKLLQT